MANKYANLVGTNKIKDEYTKINTGFDGIETDINTLDARVDTIITTPIEGAAAAQEIVDARVSAVKEKTFATLDARFEETEQDIATHKAENVSQVIDIARDVSITGIQRVATTRKAKFIRCTASINSSAVPNSTGSYASGKQVVIVRLANGMGLFTTGVIYLGDSSSVFSRGIIQNISNTGFDIEWSNIGGMIGNFNILIEVIYHGND